MNKKGVSLLVAIGISSLIIVFAIGVSKIIVSQLKSTGQTQSSNAAYYAAEAGLEIALMKMKDKEIGYNLKPNPDSFELSIEDGGATGRTAQIEYKVENTVRDLKSTNNYAAVSSNLFLVPSPWLGDADKSPCNREVPPLPANASQLTTPQLEAAALEHPCNWNRISYGETVTIPLYYLDDANLAVNPADSSGIKSLVLKMRTPCKDGKLDNNSFECVNGRYELDVDLLNGDKKIIETDDTAVNWQIIAEDFNGRAVVLLPNDQREEVSIEQGSFIRKKDKNSEIAESKINKATASSTNKYAVLLDKGLCNFGNRGDSSLCSGKDTENFVGSLLNFLQEKKQSSAPVPRPSNAQDWDQIKKEKPVLKFTVIHPLTEKNTATNIPYLEYQLITDKPIASNLQIVEVSAEINGFKQSLQSKNPIESSILEFVVHN